MISLCHGATSQRPKTTYDADHSQKRLISYLWKWGKIVELPHFQDKETWVVFLCREMPKEIHHRFPLGFPWISLLGNQGILAVDRNPIK